MKTAIHDQVAELLSDGQDRNYDEIQEALGLSRISARGALRRLSKRGIVHVIGWIPSAEGSPTPIFRFGPGEDAKYVPVPMADRRKAWKERARERDRARELEKLWCRHVKRPITRDPLVSALFGEREPIKASVLPFRVYKQLMDVNEQEAA